MDLSFPGQRTATATSCIPHDSVYMPGPRAGKSENGFFRCDTWLQIFQNDSKICEAEVTLTPVINKICKPCWKSLSLCVATYIVCLCASIEWWCLSSYHWYHWAIIFQCLIEKVVGWVFFEVSLHFMLKFKLPKVLVFFSPKIWELISFYVTTILCVCKQSILIRKE